MTDATTIFDARNGVPPPPTGSGAIPAVCAPAASGAWLIDPAGWNPTPWEVMWLLAIALFFLAKVTSLPFRCNRLCVRDVLAYVFLWPGLNPRAFATRTDTPRRRDGSRHLILGCLNLTIGLAAIDVAACLTSSRILQAWSAMIGIVLALHHGLFQIFAAFWMARGRSIRPIMNVPVAARSVSEFWSRRWNTAFRDWMTNLVFLPASRQWGVGRAGFLVFLGSGLLHEIVISIPANGGYGLPTCYFTIQAAAVQVERRFITALPGWSQRIWTWLVLIVPLPLLFHRPFIDVVILPFVHTLTPGLP